MMKIKIFLFLFLSISAISFAQAPTNIEDIEFEEVNQDVQSRLEKEHQNAYDLYHEMVVLQKLVDQMDLAAVEAISALWLERDLKEKDFLEKRMGDELTRKLRREALIKEHEEMLMPKSEIPEIKVAFLGNSTSIISESGINEEVLSKLLQSIKQRHPDAVFFMGNLVYGLHRPDEPRRHSEGLVELPVEKNIFGKIVEKDSGYYDSELFQKQLTAFSELIDQNLGKDIAFYPIPGAHEVVGLDSLELFVKHFDLKRAHIVDSKQMGYTVNLGDTFFVLMSSDYFDRKKNRVVEGEFLPPILKWAEMQLGEESPKYRYTFVVDNAPAFSTRAVFGIYNGLDKNRMERNRFWNLLMQHQVYAYFCSSEVLYDRSYRYGIWQIISGGAGTTADFVDEDDTFYHYILMTIPQGAVGDPRVEVYDLEGKLRDSFMISRNPSVLFDLRISHRVEE